MTREQWDDLIAAHYAARIAQAERNLASAKTPAERRKYATQLGSLKAWAQRKCAA
jgi:hypothetical protein